MDHNSKYASIQAETINRCGIAVTWSMIMNPGIPPKPAGTMDETFGTSGLQALTDPPIDWVRRHPAFFFASGVPSAEALVAQLLEGARVLVSGDVEALAMAEWSLVASAEDWFSKGRVPVPDDLDFPALPAFPELRPNSTRPEFLVTAFARDVLVAGPAGVSTVQGAVAQDDPVLQLLSAPASASASASWRRAIAFRGVGS